MTTPRRIEIVPSILSADVGRLAEQVKEAETAGADRIQVDVMDGHFVPNLTFGPLVVEAVRRATSLPIEAHLMIERPERHVGEFVKAGAQSVTFHAEATPNVAYTAGLLHDLGACVGVAINPATPAAALADIADELDVALAMTVNPGWGGQPFIRHSLEKLVPVRATIGEAVALEVDGGIDASTAPECLSAGANLFVAGSAIFGAPDPGEAYLAIARSVGAD